MEACGNAGADEFGVSFDPSLDLGSPADVELVQHSLSGASAWCILCCPMHDIRCLFDAKESSSSWRAACTGQQQMEESDLRSLHARAQNVMPRPLSQGRGSAMQPTPSGRDFDASTVLVSIQP